MSDHPSQEGGSRRGSARDKNPRKVLRFIEELSWLLDRYSDLDFKYLNKSIDALPSRSSLAGELHEFVPESGNRLLLVGVLPAMFTDERLFASNEDIADFAESVLGVRIPRWEKKSKFELIGHIVCNTSAADEERLNQIARALRRFAAGDTRAKVILTSGRAAKRSWNEIIQELIEGGTSE